MRPPGPLDWFCCLVKDVSPVERRPWCGNLVVGGERGEAGLPRLRKGVSKSPHNLRSKKELTEPTLMRGELSPSSSPHATSSSISLSTSESASDSSISQSVSMNSVWTDFGLLSALRLRAPKKDSRRPTFSRISLSWGRASIVHLVWSCWAGSVKVLSGEQESTYHVECGVVVVVVVVLRADGSVASVAVAGMAWAGPLVGAETGVYVDMRMATKTVGLDFQSRLSRSRRRNEEKRGWAWDSTGAYRWLCRAGRCGGFGATARHAWAGGFWRLGA